MLIKQSDYHRIYRVINSLLLAQNADPATASMYFSSFGAFILKQHFKLQAVPKGGLSAYNLDGTRVLFADHREDGAVSGAGENFHCWVEADGWAIDFMAPAFADAIKARPWPHGCSKSRSRRWRARSTNSPHPETSSTGRNRRRWRGGLPTGRRTA